MEIEQFDISRHLGPVLDLFRTSLSNIGDEKCFFWKHVNGPWGPSPGLVAVTQRRVVGARFFMNWRFIRNGSVHKALRPVDTVTHPDARRKGIFKNLTMRGLDAFVDRHDNIIFNTPNKNSLPGYLAMGWQLHHQHYRHCFIFAIPARNYPTVFHSQHLEFGIPKHIYHENTFETERTPAFVTWRYAKDDYRFTMFSHRDDALLVYKVLKRNGVEIFAIKDYVGPSDLRASLVRATAGSLRLVVTHEVESPVLLRPSQGIRIFRGKSDVVMRTSLHNWNSPFVFSAGDLEGTM